MGFWIRFRAFSKKTWQNWKRRFIWKKEYKLEEIAFGIKKNILTLIVDDDKISIDELIDQIESWENEIEFVDILSFIEL